MALMSASLGVGGALGLPAAAADRRATSTGTSCSGPPPASASSPSRYRAVVPESTVRTGGRFDLVGALGLSAGLVCLLLADLQGRRLGLDQPPRRSACSPRPSSSCWSGAGGSCAPAQPLVDLRTTARRQVLLTNLASVVVGFSMFAMSLVLPQLLQLPDATGYGLGQSMLVGGPRAWPRRVW